MISIRDVRKRFGTLQAVDGVSLEIPATGIFGIIGPNGAGKSTLFKMICQLVPPDSGEIVVRGFTRSMDIRRSIGYLPEEHHLYESLTAQGYLRYFTDLLGLPSAAALDGLRRVGLEAKRDEKISRLSKGMRQKIAFARAALGDPPVLILDEPTYGLDPRTAREMRGWIEEAARTRTVVVSSHNMYESERICALVAILSRGRVAAVGTPRALIRGLKAEQVLEVRFRGPDDVLRRLVPHLPPLKDAVFEPEILKLYTHDPAQLPALIQAVVDGLRDPPEGFALEALIPREPSLEDVFIHVTGEGAASLLDGEPSLPAAPPTAAP